METLEGTSGSSFFVLRMEVAGAAHVARSEEEATLLLPEGRYVALDLRHATIVPSIDERDTFGRLLERGLGEPFLDRAPGDHVEVRIHGVRVDEGAPLAVYGDVERELVTDGYRDGGARVPVRVAVRSLAAGEGASRRLEAALRDAARESRTASRARPAAARAPRVEDERPSMWPAWIALGPGLALALIAVVWPMDDRIVATVPAIFLSSVGVYFAARRRFLPDLRAAHEDAAGTGKRTWIGLWHGVALFIVGFFLFAGVGMSQEGLPPVDVAAVLALAATVPLGLALSLAIAQRRAFARLLRLARARASSGIGRFGALDGRVVSGVVRRARTHVLERDDYRDLEGRSHSWSRWTFVDRVHADTLEIALDGGGTAHVRPSGGAFAAEESAVRGEELVEEIRPGDRVRVVGRPSGGEASLELRSTGPDSLFVLGSRRRSARTAALRALLLHASAVLVLAFGAAVALGLAWARL